MTEDQYDFVKNELNGGIGLHIRDMIDAHQKFYNKEITNLELEFKELEIKYIAMKSRLEEMRMKEKMLDDEQKARHSVIENALQKLRKVFIGYHRRTDLIPASILKTYSDITGMAVPELCQWLEMGENEKR